MNTIVNQPSLVNQPAIRSQSPNNLLCDNIGEQIQIRNQTNSNLKDSSIKVTTHEWVRKEQPIILFLICVGNNIYSVIQLDIVIRKGSEINASIQDLNKLVMISLTIRFCLMLFNSWFMGGFKGIFYAYTMLDTIGIICLSNAAMNSMFTLNFYIPLNVALKPQYLYMQIMMYIFFFCRTGNFRLMIKTCVWNRIYVLIYKMVLYFCCLFYISYGIYYTMKQFNKSQFCTPCDTKNPICQSSCRSPIDCCFDIQNLAIKSFSNLNNYLVLITGTGLAYYAEEIKVISDFDGSAEMKTHYTVGIYQDNEAQQITMLLGKIIQKDQIVDQQKKTIINNKIVSINENKQDSMKSEKLQKTSEVIKNNNKRFKIKRRKGVLVINKDQIRQDKE